MHSNNTNLTGKRGFSVSLVCHGILLALLAGLMMLAAHPAQAGVVWNYDFEGGPNDCANPAGGVVPDPIKPGSFTGTCVLGAGDGKGGVYELTIKGTEVTETLLHSCAGGAEDCANPTGGLVYDPITRLFYFTSQAGGDFKQGTLCSLNPLNGNTVVLHSFGGSGDGWSPVTPTVVGNNLYGVTTAGGEKDQGVIYKLDLATGFYQLLYNFTGITDGGQPTTPLVPFHRLLYGTGNGGSLTPGVVFAFNPANKAFTTMYQFPGGAGGANPSGNIAIEPATGTLYGTAGLGGANGFGFMYSLIPGATKVNDLFDFGSASGMGPNGVALNITLNTLAGTTASGGTGSDGTVFTFNLSNDNYTDVLNFSGTNGALPLSAPSWYDEWVAIFTAYKGGIYSFGRVTSLRVPDPGMIQLDEWLPSTRWVAALVPIARRNPE